MSAANVQRARRGFEAALAGDLDVIAELLDEDVLWHGGDPTASGSCRSRAQALDVMRRALARGRIGELIDVIGVGDRVVVIMQPSPGPGEPAAPIANLSTFRDGRVVEMVHYPDPADALAAARG